jgi:CheY-like chemotaxis protein
MANKDGPATLEELRRHTATTSIPIIFLTATTQAGELQRLASLGARGILKKPFDPATLAAQIREMLDIR